MQAGKERFFFLFKVLFLRSDLQLASFHIPTKWTAMSMHRKMPLERIVGISAMIPRRQTLPCW